MQEFLPYYEEIKFAGHCCCAFAASFLGGFSLYAAALASGGRMGFDRSFCFALFAAAALWVFPFAGIFRKEYSEWISLALLVACLPVLQTLSGAKLKTSAVLWGAFSLSQFALLAIIYYNIAK